MAQAKPCGRGGRRPGWLPGQGRLGCTAPSLSHHPGVHCRGISHLARARLDLLRLLARADLRGADLRLQLCELVVDLGRRRELRELTVELRAVVAEVLERAG